jgi:hypothetical protein
VLGYLLLQKHLLTLGHNMAKSFDIEIRFKGDNNPEKPENDNQVESTPSKAQEKLNTEALKSKAVPKPKAVSKSKSEAETKQSALEKYASGKSTSSQELLTELESSKVKVSKELKSLMSKGALYVVKDEGFRGRAYESIKETRDHPRQNKQRMNERVSKALESLLQERSNTFAELATNTEAVQAPVVEEVQAPVVEEVQAPVIETPVTEPVVAETPVIEQTPKPKSRSKKPKTKAEPSSLPETPDTFMEYAKAWRKNLDTTLGREERPVTPELVKDLKETIDQHAESAIKNNRVLGFQTSNPYYDELLMREIQKAVQTKGYNVDKVKRSSKQGVDYIGFDILGKTAVESVANALEKPELITKEVEQAVQPVIEAKDDLFDYTQESPGKPAEPVVATKTKNAKKKLNDAIVSNVEQAAQSAAESINKAMSGDGGKKPPKGPKAPPTGDDDESGYGDNMYEGAENDDEYNPLRTLKAQVENLQRSFASKLFGEKESTFPSSLQKTFEAGKRVKDFDDVQKLIDKEVAAQKSMLKAFETSNQNTSNLLEARIKDYIDRESSKEDESIDRQKIEWLYSRLDEVRKVREDTQQEYDAIETSISTKISDSATRGFAQGKVDRDIEELQMQQKDEDKVLKQYQREFKSFVTKQYKDLANVEAFDSAKTYVQTNTGKMPQRDVVAMAKIAYDKKFEEFMSSASFESELSTEEVMSAFQEGQGKFKPEAFRPKNAPKNFYGKPQQDEPPMDIQWDPMQGGAGGGMMGGSGSGMGGGSGNGSSPPIGFGPGGAPIPPSRNNIGLLAPSIGIDIQAIKRFKVAEASINAVGQTLVAASTKQGVRPGSILGNVSKAATTAGLAGYAASGVANLGLATGAAGIGGTTALAGAAGASMGPVGLMVAGITLSTSYLAEIADNTSKNVEAFSPELILSDIDNKFKRLVDNMQIANSRGDKLANYQQSSNQLSRQLYNLGVELFDQVEPVIRILIDFMSIVVVLLRTLTILGTLLYNAMFPFIEPLAKGVQIIAKGMTTLLDWLLGRETKLPDFEQEFMKNDPRK